MKKFKTVEELKMHYSNPNANGAKCEVLISSLVKLRTHCQVKFFNGLKPQSKSDIVSTKYRFTMESKTGCGWLSAESYTKTEAEQLKDEFMNGSKIYGSDLVCYVPKFTVYDDENDLLEQGIVMPATDFTAMLVKFNLIRVKKSKLGTYGIAIQQWITSEKWGSKKSRDTEIEILNYLWNYPTLFEWISNLSI